jgi:sugar/nucleoside kinase (ribokinase family)
MKKILVVGSSNTDLIIKVPEIPRPGETLLGGQFNTFPGGKGANQAVAAARAGGEVVFIAAVGDDTYGTAAQASEIIHGKGVDTVIITLGSRGAFLSDPRSGTSKLVPGFKVSATDTTAAGDVFNGQLTVALSEGQAIEEAVRIAHAAAALSVQILGAQSSIPRREETESFLKEQLNFE